MNIGGASIHVVNLSRGLKDAYDTILVCGQIEPHEMDMSYYAIQNNVDIHVLNKMGRELSLFNDLKAFWQLYKFIKKEKPHIVHTHTAKAGTLGRLAAFFAGVPYIFHTFHGNIFKGYFSKKKTMIFIFIEKIISLITTKIITLSEKQKQEIIDLKITKAEKIEVIRLGFDFSNILGNDMYKGLFRTEHNVPEDALLVASIGRITHIKNHKLLLDIAEKFNEHNIYFAIIGDGDLKEEIQKDIYNKKLERKVFITGFYKDLKPIYTDVDVVLLTSFNEGTPVALIEAMANGKIAISTNVGGVSDFIENGVNGFFVDGFNSESFVDIIFDIYINNINIDKISENAKFTANEFFNIDSLVKNIENLYKKFL